MTKSPEMLLPYRQPAATMPAMSKKRAKLTDQIRRAVDASGMGRNELARAAGMDKALLSHFMAGNKGLSMRTLDALADVLKLDVVSRGKRPARKGR